MFINFVDTAIYTLEIFINHIFKRILKSRVPVNCRSRLLDIYLFSQEFEMLTWSCIKNDSYISTPLYKTYLNFDVSYIK